MNKRKFRRRVKLKGPKTFYDVEWLFYWLGRPTRPPILQRKR